MTALVTLLIVLSVAGPAFAQDAGTIDGIDQAYARWMKQHGVTRATLAVARGDRLVCPSAPDRRSQLLSHRQLGLSSISDRTVRGINDSVGTLAVSAAFGASWFAYYEPRPDSEARGALDRELHRAVQAVRTWPETDLYPGTLRQRAGPVGGGCGEGAPRPAMSGVGIRPPEPVNKNETVGS